MKIVPKNWRDFQHYKDRTPPWIRLHRTLLDDKEFQRLPVASRALAPMLWLLASESVDGVIDADPDELSFRLRQPEAEIIEALKPLIEKKFFSPHDDASAVLAGRLQVAVPETEALQRTETEAETEKPSRKRAEPFDPPVWIPPELWSAFLKARTKKRADNNPHALGLIVKDLDRFKAQGHDAVAILEKSVRGGWSDVYEPKVNLGQPPPGLSNAGAATAQNAANLESKLFGDRNAA